MITYEASYPIKDIFQSYIKKVNSIKSLEIQEELFLAKDYYENKNFSSAKKIVESHLKLVVKVALKYKNFGQNIIDLISEGTIGLMKAVEKFNPYTGFRFSTYAVFWIKSNIQEYILRTWSLVKIGTTTLQKKLFYSLSKMKNQIVALEGRAFQSSDYDKIAKQIGATREEVSEIDARLSGHDVSLNRQFVKNDRIMEPIDLLQSNSIDPIALAISNNDAKLKHDLIENALNSLTKREKEVVIARKILDEQKTLDDLSKEYGVSKERIRQIEVAALDKVRKFVIANMPKDLTINL